VDRAQEFIIVQEGADAIFVLQPDVAEVTSGNRVRVVGRLGEGDLLPIVSESTVTVVGTEEMLPSPKTSLATSLARMLAIGLGALMLIFTLAAFWLKLLKAQVSQEGRFEGIFDSAGCPIIVLNGNLELIDANDYASELTEYSKAELRKMSFTEIDTHKPAEEIKKVMLKVMEFRDVAIFPTKIQTSDKKVFDVEVHCRNLTQ